MESEHIDHITRMVDHGGTRRQVARALLGSALGTALLAAGLVQWTPGEDTAAAEKPVQRMTHRFRRRHHKRRSKRSRNKRNHTNRKKQNPDVGSFRDCSQVPLVPGADLSHCNLPDANMESVDLTDANLFQANLARANLFRATLTRANLSEAILAYADLADTDLRNANFVGANLKYADLTQSAQDGTDFTDARFCHTRMQSGEEQNGNCP